MDKILKIDVEEIIKFHRDLLKLTGNVSDSHPFLKRINSLELEVSKRPDKSVIMTKNLIELRTLYILINNLSKRNIFGLTEKLKELSSVNKELFDKTFFELLICHYFKSFNCDVKFLETQSDIELKTPDLLIDSKLEVECKKKDKITERDKDYLVFWEKLYSALNTKMDSINTYYAVRIKFNKDLNINEQEHIIKTLSNILDNKQNIKGKNDKLGIEFDFELKINSKPIISNGLSWSEEFSDDCDFFNVEFKFMKKENCSIISKLYAHSYKLNNKTDRLKSLINTINKAKKQFSKEKSSLIFINLNQVNEKIDFPFKKNLEKEITKILANNSSISGIVLINDDILVQDGQYALNINYFLNNNPKNKLSSEYIEILEKTKAKSN
jgi:hypothetical protein